jgi:hypothetical protein
VINTTLLATGVRMFVNGSLDGHGHLKNRGLAFMNNLRSRIHLIKVEATLSKLKHHLLAHKK